jgi:hypothetical protein
MPPWWHLEQQVYTPLSHHPAGEAVDVRIGLRWHRNQLRSETQIFTSLFQFSYQR